MHSHPTPSRDPRANFGVIVVGGGHAGIEAVLAAARLGQRAALVTFDLQRVGEMSCNPAIGGLGKGQLVREIDALGGAQGQIADQTGIQFRMLNTGKGAAVRAPRCQSDRHLYREEATRLVRAAQGVELIEGAVVALILEGEQQPAVRGIRLADGTELRAPAVILTTGTFLRARMHQGEEQSPGGRVGEASAEGLAADIATLGLELGRLKTGTPPRLDARTLDFGVMEEQVGDSVPQPFSFGTDIANFPHCPQVPCHLTWTTPATHQIIRDNVHLSPMAAGRIEGIGPRYCPSVEDKIIRFADKDRHQVFVEPEGLSTDVIYVNGVSTSLPAKVQEAFVHTIPGLERARFLQYGYAVEYDFVMPHQLDASLALRQTPGLFLAGQINGTSGYEEAAAQGLVAGTNAAKWIQEEAPFVLGRHEAYIGVMVDDLILTSPREPYRMFSSRAEHRLLLRQDNADRRLVPLAHQAGLVGAEELARVRVFEDQFEVALGTLKKRFVTPSRSLFDVLRRPEISWQDLLQEHPCQELVGLDPRVAEALEIEAKYEGYVRRQQDTVERMAREEDTTIPKELNYSAINGLGHEAREKLSLVRPATLGAAGRVEGVRPPDVALLAVHVERLRRQLSDGEEVASSGTVQP